MKSSTKCRFISKSSGVHFVEYFFGLLKHISNLVNMFICQLWIIRESRQLANQSLLNKKCAFLIEKHFFPLKMNVRFTFFRCNHVFNSFHDSSALCLLLPWKELNLTFPNRPLLTPIYHFLWKS